VADELLPKYSDDAELDPVTEGLEIIVEGQGLPGYIEIKGTEVGGIEMS
jgi:hypothetical protein